MGAHCLPWLWHTPFPSPWGPVLPPAPLAWPPPAPPGPSASPGMGASLFPWQFSLWDGSSHSPVHLELAAEHRCTRDTS